MNTSAAVKQDAIFGAVIQLQPGAIVQAMAGAHYQLVLQDSSDLILRRKGSDLIAEIDGEQIALVEDFYSLDGEGGFVTPDGELIPFAAIEVAADQAHESVLVWESQESSAYSWLTLVASSLGSAVGVGLAVASTGGDPASSASSDSTSDDSTDDAGSSRTLGTSSSSTTVTITPAAGPFISDVDVAVYDADGNLLGYGSVNEDTGNVELTLTTDYTGPVLIVVTDTNGDDADYLSEATGEATSLGGTLSAMAILDDSGALEVSVTPLTDLAVQLAGITDATDLSSTALTEEQVAYNDIIAELFGLEDLLGDAVTVVDSDYSEDDGISAAELYGQLLAILSGAEENLGSISELVSALAATISITDGVASLSAEGASLLLDGLATFETGDNADLADTETLVSDLPYLLEGDSVQSSLNASEISDGTSLVIPGVSEGDVLLITLGGLSLSLTVTADMLDESLDGSAVIELSADQLAQAGEGRFDMLVTVNGVGLQTVAITLDETAPTANIELSADSVNAGETVTVTFAFSEAVTNFSNADVVLESGTLSEVTTDDGGLTWTATYIPASSTDDASALISLSGSFTDLAGNQAATADFDGETLAAQTSLTVDTTRPTATLSVSEDTLQVGDSAVLTIVFSEAVTGFSLDDISAANALLSDLTTTDGGITWTATLTAMEGFESASNQVRIGTDYTDLSGNKPSTYYLSNSYLVDTAGPVINSGNLATVVENSGAGQVVYSADASDMSSIGYTLSGTDADYFSIDETTGEITLLADPDYETRSSYNITLIATDAYGNQSTQAIVVQVTNLDEIAPVITSASTVTQDENLELGTVIYSATSTDDSDVSEGVTYSLSGDDAEYFSIDADTGEVILATELDSETQSSYSFVVTATDAAGNSASRTVTLTVNDLDESAPVVTSATADVVIDENIGAGQVLYTFSATDSADTDDDTDTSSALVYSLSGDDEALFSLDSETGELTLLDDPDYESQSSYSVVITATDEAGNTVSQPLTVSVNDLDETVVDDSSDDDSGEDVAEDDTSEDETDDTCDDTEGESGDSVTDDCSNEDESGSGHGHHHGHDRDFEQRLEQARDDRPLGQQGDQHRQDSSEHHSHDSLLTVDEENIDWLDWYLKKQEAKEETSDSDSDYSANEAADEDTTEDSCESDTVSGGTIDGHVHGSGDGFGHRGLWLSLLEENAADSETFVEIVAEVDSAAVLVVLEELASQNDSNCWG